MDRAGNSKRALDAYLAASARAGDRTALESLAARWNGRLRAHAWRLLGDSDAAGDAVQEAWVDILRGLSRLGDAGAFGPWAYRIVSRRCARAIRGRQRGRRLDTALRAEPLLSEAQEAPEVLGQGEVSRLRAAIRGLPAGQRAAVALFHLEEMSIAETAVALDVPAGTVKTRLMHARRALRALLEGDE